MVTAKTSIELSESEYVSHLLVFPTAVVAALTDSTIYTTTTSLTNSQAIFRAPSPTPLAGMQPTPTTPLTFATVDIKGQLKMWDLRSRKPTSVLGLELSATSLGTSPFGEIAVGTEATPDAQIQIFDIRQLSKSKPLVVYKDSHNDDVTDLQFHPTIKNRMVSGSTDGVVNLFDISIKDEDEAVIEAYNHQASIHRTGFFSNTDDAIKNLSISSSQPGSSESVFALSHMETLSVYPLGDEAQPIEYGDLREAWKCQYVADFQKQHFLVGSNDEGWAKLLSILNGQPVNEILLEGGHGAEVVRCFDLNSSTNTLYTGGEDGHMRLWDIEGKFDEFNSNLEELSTSHKSKNKSKVKSGKAHKKSKKIKPY